MIQLQLVPPVAYLSHEFKGGIVPSRCYSYQMAHCVNNGEGFQKEVPLSP